MEMAESTESTISAPEKNLKKRTSSGSSPNKVEVAIEITGNLAGKCDPSVAVSQPIESDVGSSDDVEGVVNSKRVRTMQGSPSTADEAGSKSPVIPEKLEVPSKELQCIQKQVLIEKLMGTTDESETKDEESMDVDTGSKKPKPSKPQRRLKKANKAPAPPPSMKPEDFRRTFKIPSTILSRVKTFLPEMKNANEELLRLPDPSKLSLESDSDEIDGAVAVTSGASISNGTKASQQIQSKTYVEMNLALVEQSDSGTSSDEDEGGILGGKLNVLPNKMKLDIESGSATAKISLESSSVDTSVSTSEKKMSPEKQEKKPLITELN